MYQQREKLQQISLITWLAAIFFMLFGLFTSFFFALYLSCYMISAHICTEGMLLLQFSHMKQAGMRLLVSGFTLFIVCTYFVFRFLKGS